MGAIPGFIYSTSGDGILVNLFIGSDAEIKVNEEKVRLRQTTNYPWDGKVTINVDPEGEKEFNIKVRIPGWATGTENPLGLYHSQVATVPQLTVNGSVIDQTIADG